MEEQQTLTRGPTASVGGAPPDSEVEPLLPLETPADVEVTFPSADPEEQSLLIAFNDLCTDIMNSFGVVRYDVLRGLDYLVNEIEQAAAPVNGAQPNGLQVWVETTDLASYASGTRTVMVKFQEWLLEQLDEPEVDQQVLRDVILDYGRAVEYEHGW